MCHKVVEENPYLIKDVPDELKTQDMCEQVVENDPYLIQHVPDRLKPKICVIKLLKKISYRICPDHLDWRSFKLQIIVYYNQTFVVFHHH